MAYRHSLCDTDSGTSIVIPMRGADVTQEGLFTVVTLDDFVRPDHPIRPIRKLVDQVLSRMSPLFDGLYADTGRASIPPEKLLRAQLL